jgi:hypothetical protein
MTEFDFYMLRIVFSWIGGCVGYLLGRKRKSIAGKLK